MTEQNMHSTWSYVRIKATNIERILSVGIFCAPFRHFVCSKKTLYILGSYSVMLKYINRQAFTISIRLRIHVL